MKRRIIIRNRQGPAGPKGDAGDVAGTVTAEGLDYAGSTEIGAALADADELMISDGGGNTTRRKTLLSRVWTYIKSKADSVYATLAQGALADSAVQPGDNVSDLTNDAGYLASVALGDLPFGDPGEQLTTNEAGTALEFGLASKYLPVRKASVGTITAGTPVRIVSYNVAGYVEVEAADASSAATMPAIGLAFDDLTNSSTDRALLVGNMSGLDTSAYTVGDSLYVASGGGLTATKPTGSAQIQKMGIVGRSNVANGQVVVLSAGRTNDIPNFSAAGKIWIGGTGGVATEGETSTGGNGATDSGKVVTYNAQGHFAVSNQLEVFDKTNGFSVVISADNILSADRAQYFPDGSGYYTLTANADGTSDVIDLHLFDDGIHSLTSSSGVCTPDAANGHTQKFPLTEDVDTFNVPSNLDDGGAMLIQVKQAAASQWGMSLASGYKVMGSGTIADVLATANDEYVWLTITRYGSDYPIAITAQA